MIETKEYMVDGQPYTVSIDQEEKFLQENPTATLKTDEPGKEKGANQPLNNQENTESTLENTSSDLSSNEPVLQLGATGSYYSDSNGNIIQEQDLTEQQKQKIKEQDANNVSSYIDSFIPKELGAEGDLDFNNFTPPTQAQLDEVLNTDRFFLQREETVSEFLNQGPYGNISNVKFVETGFGKDEIEILIGDEEEGQGKVITLPTWLSDLATPFDKSKGYKRDNSKNLMDEINHYVKTRLDPNYEKETFEEIAFNYVDRDMAMQDANFGESNKADFAKELDNKKGDEGFSGKLEGEPGILAMGKNTTDNISVDNSRLIIPPKHFLSGLFELTKVEAGSYANMIGNVELQDGTVLSYEYLWENRQKIRDHWEKKQLSDSKETESKKRFDEGKGENENEALFNHVDENIAPYFMLGPSGFQDINIVKIDEEIEDIENRTLDPETKEKMIKELEDRKKSIVQERGYDKMELYDINGTFKGHNKVWELDESGEFYVNPNTGAKVPVLGDEDESQELADENDLQTLKEEFINSYIEVLEFGKIANDNIERIGGSRNKIMALASDLIDTNNDSFDNDTRQLQRLVESGDIFNLSGETGDLEYLTKLPEDTYIGKRFNQALDRMVTYGRAIKLNIDPTKSKQESWASEAFDSFQSALTGEHFGNRGTEDEALEVFENFLSVHGYELPEHESDNWFGKERGAKGREFLDAVTSGGAHLTPILLSLAIGNKTTGVKRGVKALHKFVKASTKNSPKVIKWGAPVIATGIGTYAEWAVGEHVGQVVFGSDGGDIWKAHTLYRDLETGEIHNNWVLPATVGMGSHIWGNFTKYTTREILKSKRYGPGFAHGLNMTPRTVKYFTGKVGQGGTAATLLSFGTLFDEGVNPFNKQGVDTFLETWALMSMVGFGKMKVPREVYNAMKADALALKSRSIRQDNAFKLLNVKKELKDGQVNETYLDNRVKVETNKIDKQIKNIEKNETMSAEKKGEEITKLEKKKQEVKEAGETLRQRNLILHAKKIAIKDNKYREFLQEQYLAKGLFDRMRAGNLTNEEIEMVGELTPESMYHIYDMLNIKPGSSQQMYYEYVVRATSNLVSNLNNAGITKGSPARATYIKNSLEGITNTYKIESLQKDTQENPSNKQKNNIEIKRLKEVNKKLAEQIQTDLKKFNIDFKKLLDAELASAKIEAKKIGFTFDVVGDKRYKRALEENNKNTESNRKAAGFIAGKKIFINRKNAIKQRNLGVGMHEVVHALLKNSLKGKDGKISKDGMKIIDGMLQRLSEKDRKLVQDRIDEFYRYDANGKEKPKNEYYEEYITVFGDAIKNKEVARDYRTGRKLAKLFYPLFKSAFPNMYKFDLGGTKSKKAVNDLYDMVQEIQSDGLTKDVLDAVKRDNSGATFSTSKGMMESLDHFNMKKKDGKLDIGLDGKTLPKFKTNAEFKSSPDGYFKAWEIFNTPSELYNTIQDPNIKKAVKDLDNIIMGPDAVKRYVESGANNYTRESFIDAVKLNLAERFEGRKGGGYDYSKNPSLFGWLYSNAGGRALIDRARGDVGMAKGGKEQVKTVSYDVKMAGGEKTFAETFADKTSEYERIDNEQMIGLAIHSKPTTSLRKKLGIQRNDPIVEQTKKVLEDAYKGSLPDIADPKFRSVVEQHVIERLRKPIQDLMGRGTGDQYKNFLLNGDTFKGIFDVMTANDLQSIEKQAEGKGGRRVLTEWVTKLRSEGLIEKYIDKGELPATAIDKAKQGVDLYRKKDLKFNSNGTMPAELRKDVEAMFIKINSDVALERLGYKLSVNSPQTRKEGLAKKIAARFASEATPEVLHTMKRKGEIPEFIHQQTMSDALAVIHRQMNATPIEAGGMMFSKGQSKVLNNLLKNKFKDLGSYIKKDGIIDLMYKDMELYDILERHVEAAYGPIEFTNEGFIKKAKELNPKIFNQISGKFWQFRKVSKKDGVKTKTFDTKTMKRQTEFYTKGMLDFLPKSELVRQQGLVQNLQILKNSLFKLQSDRSPNGNGTLESRKNLSKEYDKLIQKAGSKMTPHTKKLWEDAIKVVKNLDLAESTVQTQEGVNRAVQDIMNMKGLSRAEKIGAATTAFNPKSIDAARKFYKAYTSSIQDWVNTMESSKTMTREEAMKHVFIDFYTNSNFTKGTRMLAPITMMYVGSVKGKKKGEHLKDRSNVDAELLKSIYEGDLLKDFNTIIEGYEQAIGPKEVFDILDNLGGANNLNKAYRLMLDPKIAKDMIDLATGRDMYSILTERHALDLVNTQLKSYERSKAVTNNVKAKKKIVDFALSVGKEKRGMSTFDFDDTLAKTKSGVRATVPVKDGLPRPNRKVVFLAGGAGSGKSNVVKKLGLEKDGFKIVNSDISLEWLKKNSGLPENMNDLTKEQRSTLGKLQHQARGIARRKMMKYQGNADGVVIDGTGGSVKSMEKLVKEFKDKGYDVSMLFVETSLETAMARNKARKERSLLDVIVRKNHEAVQKNKPSFKEMFGERFMEVKTDNLTIDSPMPAKLIGKMHNFTKGYEKLRLDAEQFAIEGDAILKRGGKFDFSEFNKVVEGEQGPLFGKALERAKKFGTKDMFVLTARPAESAKAIHEFLKSQGLNIPLENITGLANSTGEAKARWMLEKFAEGYNDMYFVDDAMQNVKAVKDVLKQLDIKSKVVQAKIQFSKGIDRTMSELIERKSKGKFKADKDMSLAAARALGRGKGRFDYFVPASAEDLKGLMYKLLGRGEQGNKDMRFLKKALFDPWARGIRDLTIVKQKMSQEYAALKKKSKEVKLNEKVEDTPFTVDTAIRMYLWNKAGYEVPDISKAEQRQLTDYVKSRPDLTSFAETLSSISRVKEGYQKPSEFWMVESIGSDLNNITMKVARKDYLHEWFKNKELLFSPSNLNKLEAQFGPSYREALENMLRRMELGTNRLHGIKDGPTKYWYDWVNGSVGATMFWNTRSAMLQTISMVNFTNYADNNVFAQAKAFANQKQFWGDFAMLFNSPMLKQRRAGLEIDVSASEIQNMFERSGRNPKAVLRYMLEKGFTPTRIADSFAIAMGGSAFYRNRYNKYIKEGMSKSKAKEQSMLDFQEIAEETQQSSRPDLISQQQAGPLGRIILAWQNTPMQMTRLMKKSLSDIVNRRKIPGQTQAQSDVSNISRILYYGMVQNIWFATLQSGFAWMLFGSDMEDKMKSKEGKILNSAFDTLLRGTGVYGAAASTFKNTLLRYKEEKNKPPFKQDFTYAALESISFSPPIGSKLRKIYSAIKSWGKYNASEVGDELGLRIENPELMNIANIVEAATNVPMARTINKINNLEEAITGKHEWWQRAAMASGWNRWNIGVKDEEYEAAKDTAYEKIKERNKIESKKRREEEKKKEEIEKRKKGIKTVRCFGRTKAGNRCKNKTETAAKTWKCYAHR